MKKMIAACVIGLSALSAVAAPSLAMAQDAPPMMDRDHRDHGRPHDRDFHRHHPPHCVMKVEKKRIHGEWVVKKTQFCR